MTSKNRAPLFIILLFWLMSSASAAEFRAGKDYEELNFPQPVETGKKIEVREFFWYGCPHCYTLEPTLRHWKKNKPANVAFIRSPSIANPRWQFHARMYFALDAMGKINKTHGRIFKAIHVDKKKLNTVEGVAKFLVAQGIKREDYLRASKSFGVRLKLKRAEQAALKYEIHGVPTIIVDGKYRTSPSKAGGEERMMRVVNFLARKAAKERR